MENPRLYESKYLDKGYKNIAGTDEAGRGPLAGPLVVASVILPNEYENPDIDDSKKITDKKRRELFEEIKKVALAYSIKVIPIEVIDTINIYEASRQGMIEATKSLKIKPDVLLTDCMPISNLDIPVESIIKGDAKSISIAAASILAKVTRDDIMIEYDKIYPEYDFASNKGYGTKKHYQALDTIGITPIHRRSYNPVKQMLLQQLKLDI